MMNYEIVAGMLAWAGGTVIGTITETLFFEDNTAMIWFVPAVKPTNTPTVIHTKEQFIVLNRANVAVA